MIIISIIFNISCFLIGAFIGRLIGRWCKSNERKNWEDTRQSLDNDDKLDDTEI